MKSIGGPLDLVAIGQLYGPVDSDEARMRHFHVLDHDAQAAAIRRMAAIGRTEYGIAAATGLSVEMVRRLLGHEHAIPSEGVS